MNSSRLMLSLFLPFLFQILVSVAQEPIQFFHICLENGNFTSNSTYENNLQQALSSLSSNTGINYGFSSNSFGRNPDNVTALSLCRGDKTTDACRSCINNSTQEIRQSCPYQKEAIIWSDDCMLRYSNRSILSNMEFEPALYLYNMNNVSDVTQFNQVVKSLLDNLTTEAGSGNSLRKFATGNTTVKNNQTVYGLVQCTPDLSKQQCYDCLRNATSVLPQCCSGKQGGRVLGTSCQFRYESYVFYDSNTQTSEPPSPSPSAEVAPTPVSEKTPSPSAALAPTPVSEQTPSPSPGPASVTGITPSAAPAPQTGPEPVPQPPSGTTPSPLSSATPPPPPTSFAFTSGMASNIVQTATLSVISVLLLNKF